jgi:signal transduction histidine kinase
VDAFEGQHGAGAHCLTTIADYVLRIYLLRMVLLAAIALFAVRLAMQPLRRMITAAEALGDNIDRPPLPTRGPAEVKQAAEAFNTMQARLLKVMQERSHFLAAVSHDLRSPITRLRLRTETRLHDDLRDSFRRDLHEMESLIDATLSFIQDGTVMQDAVALDLFPILGDLAQLMREQGGKVALSGVRQATMRGYPQSLKRCFQNLIENALRYAGIAQVGLEVDDHAVRVHVRDDGPGIPPDQLERMLEPFQRLEASRSTATGGFGLGLSIAINIVKAHGGTLVLSNLPTGGLSVDVTFPKSFENIPETIVDVTASQGA